MSDHLQIDPPEAVHQAGALHTVATDLAAAVGPVLDHLAGLGNYWGTDQIGKDFAASYQPHVDRVEPALSDAVGDLSTLSEALRWAATHLSATDQSSAASILRTVGGTIPANPVF